MKKTISVIYRLSFIIFSIWALLENVGFKIPDFPMSLTNFVILTDTLCFFIILLTFITSILRSTGNIILRIKAAFTVLAAIVLLSNYTMILSTLSIGWILKILLPIMMILDFIIFDRKGSFRIYDPLLWLIFAALTGGILYYLLKNVFNLPNFLDLLGLFKSKDDLIKLLLGALSAGVLLYLIDNLLSKGGRSNLKNFFPMLFRLFFLLMEIWAFYRITGLDLTEFIYSLSNYIRLSNFLCFLCIAAVLIYNFIKMNSAKRAYSPFPRLKGCFTLAIAAVFIYTHFFAEKTGNISNVTLIHCYVAPFMMLFDWLLFDKKGAFKPYDPLLWLIIPVGHVFLNYIIINPVWHSDFGGTTSITFTLFFTVTGILLAVGYLIYIIDICLSKK